MGDEAGLFALCPIIEPNGAERKPLFFDSAAEGEEWLDHEATLDDLGVEGEPLPPDMMGWPEEARVEMAEWIENLRRQKRDAQSRIITNRRQGWVSVPVRRLADYPGSKCARSVRDFLPLGQIGDAHAERHRG
jgi:hypothetical protein